ncbi:haloacid dehalogenase-like hydrolase [Cytobacillus oceanisediminis]|uniref:haloacid dehalogenase-like hydrolase n=2 Tax=Bacillaceae TaxID=186817 RepID=UPI001C236CB6|nr:haloacid dehalogenase-like hydrolase [Cytobacillus oceanisediminis]MBU8733526.1 haloacid dehalogenase-like hydrolase [Cytobacillus oceanisediminis]
MNNRTKLKVIFGMIVICMILSASLGAAASEKGIWTPQKREGHYIQVLDKGKWAPDTYKAVQNLIDRSGAGSPGYDPNRKPYVVFDWDHTSIMNDTEEALFLYQIDQLAFNMQPEEFYEVIKKNVPNGPFSHEFKNLQGDEVTLEEIAEDLKRDYEFLYSNYEGMNGKEQLETLHSTDQFIDFKAKMYFLYEAIGETHGIEIGYPWVLYLFANMSTMEVQQLAEASNDYNLGAEMASVSLVSPESMSGRAGTVQVAYTTGLRLATEIANLMHTFMENGIDVYVISASMEEVVEVFSSNPKYGYNLPKENVFGMRLKKKDGIIQAEYKDNWPITAREGKVEVIEQTISKARGGYGPIFVAGDSSTDYEMLTIKSLKLGLIINRLKTGDIGKLANTAAERMGKNNPKYVLQGRNENTGLWIPTEYTIKLGSNEEKLLANP